MSEKQKDGVPSVDMAVSLAGVTLKNPIVTVSGTFGFGREYGQYFDLSRLGGLTTKGLTLEPREGNPPPRVAETPLGMLNSVGLQNPGVEAFLQNEWPFLQKQDTVIIANISGNTVEDYERLASRLCEAGLAMLEVNISCPNVKAGGLAFGVTAEGAAAVTKAVRRVAGDTPVIVKLSPNVTDIAEIARACETAGADALSLINTLRGMRIDVHSRKPILKMNIGGLSGPAVLPIAVRCVFEVSRAVKIPILGMGGVQSGEDAAELMLAGATAVGVGSAMFRDPLCAPKVAQGLRAYCETHGVEKVSTLTGSALA